MPRVNASGGAPERRRQPSPVKASSPGEMASGVVSLRPLALEECLRPAIPALLLPVGSHRVSSMVPDHGAGVISDAAPRIRQPPTEVHVVASGAKSWIEPARALECRLAKSHIAAGNVFCLEVGNQDVDRAAR